MKKAIAYFVFAIGAMTLFSSCGTIMGTRSKVHLVNSPSNLVVKADGEAVPIKMDAAMARAPMYSNYIITYYVPTVKINKKKPVELELISGEKSGKTISTPKFSGAYFMGNMFVGGLISGVAIDLATKSHKQHPRFIDVPAVLDGKPKEEWRSKRKLKKEIKSISKKNKKTKA